jgi:UDP-sugar transporter A1/2/3
VIVAASHLDAVTFQICSQSFKILPTAFFAVWLLGQYLAPMQWASLPVLAIGVIFVTVNGSTSKQAAATTGLPTAGEHLLLGLGASALSGLSSAYAGLHTVNSCSLLPQLPPRPSTQTPSPVWEERKEKRVCMCMWS